tara:strand:+ start:36380 stop:37783 length:1404 start_codon:yes stop_codon:yes gene_type:complete
MGQAGTSINRGLQSLQDLGAQYQEANTLKQQEQEAENLARFQQFASGLDSSQLQALQQSNALDSALQQFGVKRADALPALNNILEQQNTLKAQEQQLRANDYNFQRGRTEDQRADELYTQKQQYSNLRNAVGNIGEEAIDLANKGEITTSEAERMLKDKVSSLPGYQEFGDEIAEQGLLKPYIERIKTSQKLSEDEATIYSGASNFVESEAARRAELLNQEAQQELSRLEAGYRVVEDINQFEGSPATAVQEAIQKNAKDAGLDLADLTGEDEEIPQTAASLLSEFEKLKKQEEYKDLPSGVVVNAARRTQLDDAFYGVNEPSDDELQKILKIAADEYKAGLADHETYINRQNRLKEQLNDLDKLKANKLIELSKQAKQKRADANKGKGFQSIAELFDVEEFNKKLDEFVVTGGKGNNNTDNTNDEPTPEETEQARQDALLERALRRMERLNAADKANPLSQFSPKF